MDILKILIEFIITFCLIYTFYYFFVIRKYRIDNHNIPIEVNIILVKNKIDSKKINLYMFKLEVPNLPDYHRNILHRENAFHPDRQLFLHHYNINST